MIKLTINLFSKICINTLGSYKCACNEGYVLHMDNQTCIDKNMAAFRDGETHTVQQIDQTGNYFVLF
jgi:hypothetical protein